MGFGNQMLMCLPLMGLIAVTHSLEAGAIGHYYVESIKPSYYATGFLT
jgi:hypothetical protein